MNVILGVTGGISAYKACDIISGLKATGHTVKVIMTESAKRFVTEEVLAVMSEHQVFTDANRDLDGTISHISLSQWGDLLLIAPATGNTMSKIHCKFADNFLTTVALAYEGRKVMAPAMNPKMWQKIVRTGYELVGDGWEFINPVEGLMACGDTGMGKLEKPRKIVDFVNNMS